MTPSVIAVLMACHNRRDQTLACLGALHHVRSVAHLVVYLVDDGSVDGTAEAVEAAFPDVRLVQGDGMLFWARGMKLAERIAVADGHETHLWLNDDVQLDPGALETLLATSRTLEEAGLGPCIVSGALRDPQGRRTTYGGLRRRTSWRPMRFDIVEALPWPRELDTMNGNVVLVPADVLQRLGGIDDRFTHNMADMDFGLRARAAGMGVWLAPGHVGTCAHDPARNIPAPGTGTWARLRARAGVRQLPPQDWIRFTRRHAGPLWPVYAVAPYVRAALGAARR